MPEKLTVFISYTHEDQSDEERLWQILGERGHDCWLDIKNIHSSSPAPGLSQSTGDSSIV